MGGRSIRRLWIITFAFVLLVPTAISSSGHPDNGTLDFGLTDEDQGPADPDRLTMLSERPGEGGLVPVATWGPVVWVSEQTAREPIDIAEQTVVVHVRFALQSGVEFARVEVGTWDFSSGFIPKGETVENLAPRVQQVNSVNVPVEEHTLETNDHLALRFSVHSTEAVPGLAVVDTGPSTAVHYSQTPPSEAFPFAS